jgi:type I restriction enzyme R subunit
MVKDRFDDFGSYFQAFLVLTTGSTIYVSEYNFQQSMEDGATVPLFYEKRVPEVLIHNEGLSDEFYAILEDENLDESQQAKLEKRFAQEVEIIKRDDRLETIAKDIVFHFPRRGYLGKGLVVSVDKFTAVKMYDKVQRLWKEEIKSLVGRIRQTPNEIEKHRLQKLLAYMRNVEMAVVISEEADEEKKWQRLGLDIKPHRARLNRLDEQGHDIEYNFKDATHPLQLVFVCAMWLTGFDAPTLSTLYLDKPMKDHTLMQTIARANRVTPHVINGVTKQHGEIIDYYNVFRNMKKALKEYAQGQEGLAEPPVREKAELITLLGDAIIEGIEFCREKGILLRPLLLGDEVFKNLGLFNSYADILLSNDEWRKSFTVYENTISALYEACKPEIVGQPPARFVAVFQYLRGVIESIIDRQDIAAVNLRIAELLDESVVVENAQQFTTKEYSADYQIIQRGKSWDLSQINFEKLRAEFAQTAYKHIQIADLRAFLHQKLTQMLQQNLTRIDFAQRLQQIIDTYNAGGSTTENYFDELMNFAQDLHAEAERHVREGLSEDELELFDLLKKAKMSQAETQTVKLAAKKLLHRLREEQPPVLVQAWHKDSQTQRIVRSAVEQVLHDTLPDSYDRIIFKEKCDTVFAMIFTYASQGQKWVA